MIATATAEVEVLHHAGDALRPLPPMPRPPGERGEADLSWPTIQLPPDHGARWRTSMHEAAHVVGYLRAGHDGHAYLLSDRSGLALTIDACPLDPFVAAVIAAAGSAAEVLADQHARPAAIKAAATWIAPPTPAASEPALAHVREMHRRSPSDAATIKAFCTEPDDPASWARRHAWVMREADKFVHANAPAILRHARRLYVTGTTSTIS